MKDRVFDYISSFSKRKKILFVVSAVIFAFEAILPIVFLVNEHIYFNAAKLPTIYEYFTIFVSAPFVFAGYFGIYSFAFPFLYFAINVFLFIKQKYDKKLAVLDFLLLVINPIPLVSVGATLLIVLMDNTGGFG